MATYKLNREMRCVNNDFPPEHKEKYPAQEVFYTTEILNSVLIGFMNHKTVTVRMDIQVEIED